MKYGFLLTPLGVAQLVFALNKGLAGWLLCWSGISFVVAGLGYGWLGPRVFGKKANGRMAWPNVALLFPFLLLTWGLWHLQRLLAREAGSHEIAPGLWLGRRPFIADLPSNTTLIIDLTAEFPVARGVKQNRAYLCLPTLDTGVPELQALQQAVQQATECQGNIYVHCALGHGRSAMTVMAILLAKGLANDVADAEAIVKAARPGIRLSRSQRALLEQFCQSVPQTPCSERYSESNSRK